MKRRDFLFYGALSAAYLALNERQVRILESAYKNDSVPVKGVQGPQLEWPIIGTQQIYELGDEHTLSIRELKGQIEIDECTPVPKGENLKVGTYIEFPQPKSERVFKHQMSQHNSDQPDHAIEEHFLLSEKELEIQYQLIYSGTPRIEDYHNNFQSLDNQFLLIKDSDSFNINAREIRRSYQTIPQSLQREFTLAEIRNENEMLRHGVNHYVRTMRKFGVKVDLEARIPTILEQGRFKGDHRVEESFSNNNIYINIFYHATGPRIEACFIEPPWLTEPARMRFSHDCDSYSLEEG